MQMNDSVKILRKMRSEQLRYAGIKKKLIIDAPQNTKTRIKNMKNLKRKEGKLI
ncbi:hypothetical protein TTHERM_000918501 (macronuclear) [Tetrahymena thermophila SB210]|uniref:Uncharacterized protein n=1 Tax=Tetrahymena thermophila (strain SB210) TaxID=312017 RepID=W7WZE2_TETTS|nr:hypothetical protein TTHERM_000918501 [Tetrahymena thermophila SB210]EWS70972.1 hypothetical protein TTHERM_000918501 [Tetrahymena thermophila SB210]|eukprot:XP_012656487.1 hypothetical protein TTHERM_000918501 [Tetrahymena thermophila SB210]